MLLEERKTNLGEQKNESSLKSFSIYGLFGYKNITIPFDKKALIIISENGAGKTTILKILYYTLSCKFRKIVHLNFECVKFVFTSGEIVEIRKTDIEKFLSEEKNLKNISSHPASSFDVASIEGKTYMASDRNNIRNIQEIKETITNNLAQKIMYFATSRRIEEELNILGEKSKEINFNNIDTEIVRFGMNDIENEFKNIEVEMIDCAIEIFGQTSGEILKNSIRNGIIEKKIERNLDIDIIRLIFKRIEGKISFSEDEDHVIEELIKTRKIYDLEQNLYLMNFLSTLIKLYNREQKRKDEVIRNFISVCNKYFEYFNHNDQRKIIYDEAKAKIEIFNTADNRKIELKNLSSGEKQIVSLFFKVYLEAQEDFIFIIDEPELSLSIDWQELLLPDILKAPKCKFLLATTHSPFIFNNELDLNATGLDTFVMEK